MSEHESLKPREHSMQAESMLLHVDVIVRLQARFRGNRARRAKRQEDMQLLYRQKQEGARKFLAETTEALTAGINPYVTIRHSLYTRGLDKTRGVEQRTCKSQQNIGRTHSYYLEDSTATAIFTHMRGRDLKTPPHNTFTFLVPLQCDDDEVDELQLQVMSEEIGADSFVGVSILDLASVRRQAQQWLAQGDASSRYYQHECSLWVKYAGRRQGSIDFGIRLRHIEHTDAPHEYEHGVVSNARPKVWGQRDVLACTITIVRTCGLRDPNAVSQPLFELTHAPLYENVFKAVLFTGLYLVVGCVFYSVVPCALHRGDQDECITASLIDAIYFSMVTLTTVGYGDMGPKTPGTRLFTCFFGIGGVGLAGLSLGVFIDEIKKYRARAAAAKRDINYAYHFTGRYAELGAPTCSDPYDDQAEEMAELNAQQEATKAASHRADRCRRFFYWFTQGGTAAALFGIAAWTAAGAMFFCLEKSWLRDDDPEVCSVIDAFYFAVITSTTIGYGDESPSTPAGRLFAVVYLPVSTIFFCNLVGALASEPFEHNARKAEQLVRDQFGDELTAEELRMLCRVGEPSCTFHEYVLAMMVKLGKIDQDDIDDCAQHFQKLDVDNDGKLTVNDLNAREQEDYATGHGVRESRSLRRLPSIGPLTAAPRAGDDGQNKDVEQQSTNEQLRP